MPDRSDWTWVLDRPCPQCGYDTATIDRSELAARIRAGAAAWRQALGRGELVHQRPPVEPGQSPVWSALEYGAHVRDGHRHSEERLMRLLSEDDPTFPDWDQDRAAIDGDYRSQDPGSVGYALAVSAGRIADMLDRVSGDGWRRAGLRSDGHRFTVESWARYFLHDVEHHLWDVEQGYRALTPDDEGDVIERAEDGWEDEDSW
jgi:hypothetical protein